MKTCINGNGQDSTTALRQHMEAGNPIYTAELFALQAARSDGTPFASVPLLTTWASPLLWSPIGTFLPAVIKHSGIEANIGLESQELDLDWAPAGLPVIIAQAGVGAAIEDYYQAFQEGLFDHAQVRIWRTFMPTPGDSNFFGAVHMFEGRMGDIPMDRLAVHPKVASAMDVLNRQLPPNLVEASNINAPWLLAQNPVSFLALAASDVQTLIATVVSAPATTFAPSYFQYGHVYFPPDPSSPRPGELGGHYRQIQDSWVLNGQNVIRLFEPLPFAPNINTTVYGTPAAGEPFQAFPPHPQSNAANTPGSLFPAYQGFPHTPRPEDSL